MNRESDGGPARRPRWWRRPSRRKAALLAAPIASLLLVEVAVRRFAPEEVDPALLREARIPGYFAPFTRYCDDPSLYYALRPDLDADWDGVRLRTDGDGMRVPSTGRPAEREGAVRLAVVGASVAFGHRVAFEEAYPHLLARALEERWKAPVDLRVFAVPGYCAEQKARLFETAVLGWEPDLVLWDLHHRDAYPILAPNTPIGLEPEYGENPLGSALVKFVLRRRQLGRLQERAVGRREDHEWLGPFPVAGPLVERHRAFLERVAQRAAAANVPVHLFVYESLAQTGPAGIEHERLLHAPLLPLLEAAGFVVHDVWPDVQTELESRGWTDQRAWWLSTTPLDDHPNPEGHRFWAQALARHLADHRPPAGG